MTFAAWRTLVKNAFQGGEPTAALLLRTVVDGARAVTVRDVESDLALSKSYANSFSVGKVKLAGTRITDSVGDVIIAAKALMPIDDDTAAITAMLENAITGAYDDINGMADKWDAYLIQAAKELQVHVPFYQVRQITSFVEGGDGVETTGFISIVALPETARIQQLWYGHYYAALEADVEYEADDKVVSNGRVYKVITGGTLTIYDIGVGLTSTDGEDEDLGDLVFRYHKPEKDWPVRQMDWNSRNLLAAGDFSGGPAYVFPPQSDVIWLYPALDDKHRFDLEWVGVTEDFADLDEVTFDKTAAEAAAHYIRAMLYTTELDDARNAAASMALFQRTLRKAVLDNQDRDMGSPTSVAFYDYRRRWRGWGCCGIINENSNNGGSTDMNPNAYLARTLLSPGNLSIWSNASNMTNDMEVTGTAGAAIVVLETEGHEDHTLIAGDKMRVRVTLPAVEGILISFRTGAIYGADILPAQSYPDQIYYTDGITELASFDFVFNGTDWEYDTGRSPA